MAGTEVPPPPRGTGNDPVPSTYAEVAAHLRAAAAAVEAEDSWEGFMEWSIPDMDEVEQQPPPEIMLRAVYRHGNRDYGQGFVRVIGTMNEGRPDAGD